MKGTIVDVIVVLLASLIGLWASKRLPAKYEEAVRIALGLTAVPIGVLLFLNTGSSAILEDPAIKGSPAVAINPVIVLLSVTLGFLVGYWIKLHELMESAGDWLKQHSSFLDRLLPHKDGEDFISAFVTATAVSIIGPLAVMGPITAGTTGNCDMLYTKCVFDFFATIMFAAGMGRGVLFSAIPIFLFQGAITLGASFVSPILTQKVLAEMTAVGGVLIMAMGVNVSGIKSIKVTNFLPAILLAIPVSICWEWLWQILF